MYKVKNFRVLREACDTPGQGSDTPEQGLSIVAGVCASTEWPASQSHFTYWTASKQDPTSVQRVTSEPF